LVLDIFYYMEQITCFYLDFQYAIYYLKKITKMEKTNLHITERNFSS
jgi:hypothetical protein